MNYSLLIIGDSKVDGDGGEVDGDGGDGDGDRWRWLRGHFPVPAGCRNRDLGRNILLEQVLEAFMVGQPDKRRAP
jgi:hypothetical protein